MFACVSCSSLHIEAKAHAIHIECSLVSFRRLLLCQSIVTVHVVNARTEPCWLPLSRAAE